MTGRKQLFYERERKKKYQSVEFSVPGHNATVLTTPKIFLQEYCHESFLSNPLLGNKSRNFLLFHQGLTV